MGVLGKISESYSTTGTDLGGGGGEGEMWE